jgi:signal transduction histidine kinase
VAKPVREFADSAGEEDSRSLESAAAAPQRQELAQTLHDTLSQSLTGLHIMAVVLSRKLQQRDPESAAEASEIAAAINRTSGELQEIVRSLRS